MGKTKTSEEWQSRLRILNERVDDVATKTSSMLAKSCSLNDASKGLKDQESDQIRGVTVPLFIGSESGARFAKRLKILLCIQIHGQKHNTSLRCYDSTF